MKFRCWRMLAGIVLALAVVFLHNQPGHGQDISALIKASAPETLGRDTRVVLSEYWSADRHWVKEGLLGSDRTFMATYEVAGGTLREISFETMKLDPQAVTRRGTPGSNLQKKILNNYARSVVRIERTGGLGAGVIISEDGLILTNRHVIVNTNTVFVSFYEIRDENAQYRRFIGRVVCVDKVRDLALIKVQDPPPGLKALPLNDTVQVDTGDQLFAIGHPLGEDWTITQGVASGIKGFYEWEQCLTKNKARVIQFQTPISPGNSGGPLLSDNGNLLGINTFAKGGGQNLNFAVYITELKNFVDNRAKYSADDVYDWLPISSPEMRRDLEKNGIIKAQQCDFENDGKIDIVRLDSDNNGDWDRMLMDVDHDGRFEFVALDVNEDAEFETLLLVSSRDNQPDYVFQGNPPMRIPVAVRYLRN